MGWISKALPWRWLNKSRGPISITQLKPLSEQEAIQSLYQRAYVLFEQQNGHAPDPWDHVHAAMALDSEEAAFHGRKPFFMAQTDAKP